MRILILAAFAAAAPAASAPTPAPADPAGPAVPVLEAQPVRDGDCARRDFRYADARLRAELKRLDELPAGDVILAVYNEVDGCIEPVIVSHGVPRPDAAPAAPPEPVRLRPRVYPPGS